jgi:hypothetical protein
MLDNDDEVSLGNTVRWNERSARASTRMIRTTTYESPSVTVTRDTFPLTGDETICSIFMALRTQMLEGPKPSQQRLSGGSKPGKLTGHQP